MNAVSLKTDTGGNWDCEADRHRYGYLQDLQRSPAGVPTGTNFTTNGLIARLDGTGWATQDSRASGGRAVRAARTKSASASITTSTG